MENINDVLKNQGGENNQPQNTGFQNPTTPNTGYKNPTRPAGGYISPKPPKKKRAVTIAAVTVVVIVAAVVICLLALNGKPKQTDAGGFVSTTESDANSGVSTTAEELTSENSEPTTFPEPEGGWAKGGVRELAKNIMINGEKISLPCTIGDLRAKGFECDDETPETNDNKSSDWFTTKWFSTGDIEFETQLRKYDYSKSLDENTVSNLHVYLQKDSTTDVSIGPFGRDATYDDLKKYYGELELLIKIKEPDTQAYILRDESIENYNAIFYFVDGRFFAFAIDDWYIGKNPKLNEF